MTDANAHRGDIAEKAFVGRLLRVQNFWKVSSRIGNAEGHTAIVDRLCYLVRFRDRGCKHFLSENMLSRFCRLDHHLAMQIGRCDDAYGIDGIGRQQLIQIFEPACR